MTDQTTADLIAWLRREQGFELSPLGKDYTPEEIASALEAAEQEKTEAWRVAGEQTRLERDRAEAAEQRADEAEREMHARELHHFEEEEKSAGLAAVVEKVRGEVENFSQSDNDALSNIEMILATAPADALREVKAEVWREGVAAIDPDATDIVAALNPYRDEEQP